MVHFNFSDLFHVHLASVVESTVKAFQRRRQTPNRHRRLPSQRHDMWRHTRYIQWLNRFILRHIVTATASPAQRHTSISRGSFQRRRKWLFRSQNKGLFSPIIYVEKRELFLATFVLKSVCILTTFMLNKLTANYYTEFHINRHVYYIASYFLPWNRQRKNNQCFCFWQLSVKK